MTASSESASAAALARVHDGWSHIQHQRPQAAWAAWQQALRLVPEFAAAQQALERLAAATELPAAARAAYRFLNPSDPGRRAHWDQRFQAGDLEDLDTAAAAFAALAASDPGDGAAAYNEGLCLAWKGRNAEAVAALERAVERLAAVDFDRAVEGWTLAEVLRHGGGAETLADDMSFAWIVDAPAPDLLARLADPARLVAIPTPADPLTGDAQVGATVFEWLDRPMPGSAAALHSPADLPRLLTTVVQTPRLVRFSSPEKESLESVDEPLSRAMGAAVGTIRRESTPLPLPLLDAAVWSFRIPRGLEPAHDAQLTRGAVETYFEDHWIHIPRQGLQGLSPLKAARRAGEEPVLRAKLRAVVALREQLGARPRTVALYQGYPFDRLRRRLGLELDDPASIDLADASAMSEAELDRLDPATLDDVRLADAFESAAGLRDDSRTARFAALLARRETPRLSRSGLTALFAPLVRVALADRQPEQALAWLKRARALETGPHQKTFAIWTAEVHARSGNPDAALGVYQSLLDQDPADTALALDAAETLLDNGFDNHAQVLLRHAQAEAVRTGDRTTVERIHALGTRPDPGTPDRDPESESSP